MLREPRKGDRYEVIDLWIRSMIAHDESEEDCDEADCLSLIEEAVT